MRPTTSNQPVWLLDVDGVINAVTKNPDTTMWPDWTRHVVPSQGQTWPILAANPVLDFIREVVASGRAEVRWHTTWQDDANTLADMFGLPRLEVAQAPEYRSWDLRVASGWWKRPAAERVLREERRPLIWTDDEINLRLRNHDAADVQALGSVLLVCPNSHTGLAPKHLQQIERFLDLYAAPAPYKREGRLDASPAMLRAVKVAAYQPGHHLPHGTHGKTVRGLVLRDLAEQHTDCPCVWYVLTPDGLALAAEHGVTHTYEQEGHAA